MFKFSTKSLALSGMIAALYVALSLITFPVASGAIQIRLSEGLTLLPLIMPEAIPAVFIGCMLSNLITGCAIFDVVFGGLITLVAGLLTYLTAKIIKNTATKIVVGGIFPVALNAFLLPLIWIWCYGVLEYAYFLQVGFLLISQSISVYAFGTPIYLATNKLKNRGVKFFT
jgi:uncharacterized membrane protein